MADNNFQEDSIPVVVATLADETAPAGELDLGEDLHIPGTNATPVVDWYNYTRELEEWGCGIQFHDRHGRIIHPCVECYRTNWEAVGNPTLEKQLAESTDVRVRSWLSEKELIPCVDCILRMERDDWRINRFGSRQPTLARKVEVLFDHVGPIDYQVPYPDDRPDGQQEGCVQMFANCYRCGTVGPAEYKCDRCRCYRVLYCTDSGRVICPVLLSDILGRTGVLTDGGGTQNHRMLRRVYLTEWIVTMLFNVWLSVGTMRILKEIIHDHERFLERTTPATLEIMVFWDD